MKSNKRRGEIRLMSESRIMSRNSTEDARSALCYGLVHRTRKRGALSRAKSAISTRSLPEGWPSRAKEVRIPRMGTSGTSGVLNGLGRSGRFTRRIHTPAQTITNASSVPMFTSTARSPMGMNDAKPATQTPTTIDEIQGVRNSGMDRARPFRQKSVARHRIEHARLAEQHHKHDAAQARHGARLHQQAAPAHARGVNGDCDRSGNIQIRRKEPWPSRGPKPKCKESCRSPATR